MIPIAAPEMRRARIRLRALVTAAGDGRHRLAAEDRRDHLVRRAVADAGQHEQEDEAQRVDRRAIARRTREDDRGGGDHRR
jgi:hypothetical protein